MCTCMFVCRMYAWICVHCVCIYIYVCMYAGSRACLRVFYNTHLRTCVYACMYLCTHRHMHCTHMHKRASSDSCTPLPTMFHVLTDIIYTYTCRYAHQIYIRTHIHACMYPPFWARAHHHVPQTNFQAHVQIKVLHIRRQVVRGVYHWPNLYICMHVCIMHTYMYALTSLSSPDSWHPQAPACAYVCTHGYIYV